MLRRLASGFAGALLVHSAALGQSSAPVDPPEPPPASAEQVSGEAVFATFDEPFNDPGNVTARSLAEVANVSLEEAARRLRLMVEASRLSRRLSAQYPDSFVGVEIQNEPSFGIRVVFKGSDEDASALLQRQSIAPELVGEITADGVDRTLDELKSIAESLLTTVKALGITADMAVSGA